MKRVLCLVCLLLGITAFAQKSYVTVTANSMMSKWQTIQVTGNVPSEIKTHYDSYYDNTTIGDILNQLSAKGYAVEHMSSCAYNDIICCTYLLSKSAGNSLNGVEVIANDDADVREVARYNIQGFPVNKNDKGVQIVVYSSFTAKTVIVE